ncbi:hypothetical protein ACK2GQ_05305 [Clostridioides difficile]
MLQIIPDDIDFIFGHPMAGREKRVLILQVNKFLMAQII